METVESLCVSIFEMRRRKRGNQRPSLARSQILERNLAHFGYREESKRAERTVSERVCDSVTGAAGEPWFAYLHAAWFTGWLIVNSGWIPGVKAFDPFPFSFLTFVVSLEAIFLSLAILMTQSRENRESDDRAKLDLQINLLAEREATKTLELLRAICKKYGMPEADDTELRDLLTPTDADRVLDELEKQRPDKQAGNGDQKKSPAVASSS